ncbi:precorrin-3B synthase [Planobispora rosea]|uniref:Precorrin-3B synthase n=1 Tax=Planobispora rosea TaxID=35762 RepID=A0A8J3S7P1_PLARO|nr:precorrin-3B synthase [Planobispora rosea]GGT01465.1 precorrin-3B synthase [Planobispora rosea]GIH88349.1 precorrin-3B synthase [Planobispora rosea]
MVNLDLSGRTRLDACPGALQVHAAADGGLARVRVPGGRLTAAQLRELALAAAGYGTGVIELTSRANVQVRGLRSRVGVENEGRAAAGADAGQESGAGTAGEAVPGFADRMARAGLLPSSTHERVRNILASPLTGCDDAGAMDVGPLVAELDRRLCSRPALAGLPGRFLFALDDGRGDVAGLGADAGTSPVDADETGAAHGADGTGRTDSLGGADSLDEVALIIAGADSGLRVPRDGAVPALLAVAEAFLAELSARAVTAWRIGELPGGPAAVTTRVRAALGLRSGEPVRLRHAVRGPVGIIPGRDGRVALGVTVPLGRLTSAQAGLLADAAASGEVRLTPWRGVVLPGLTRPESEAAIAALSGAGLVTAPGSAWDGVSACTGRPGCAKSLTDVQSDAATAIATTVASGSGPERSSPPGGGERPVGEGRGSPGAEGGTLPVHWAGCERRCGRPRGRVVEVVATDDGYRVDLDDRSLTFTDIGQTAAAVAAARGEK